MRIDQAGSAAGGNVAADQVPQQRGFSHAGLALDGDVAAAVIRTYVSNRSFPAFAEAPWRSSSRSCKRLPDVSRAFISGSPLRRATRVIKKPNRRDSAQRDVASLM